MEGCLPGWLVGWLAFTGERITFGGAVDRAAVGRAVDLAASVIFWGPGAKGRGPNWPLGTQGPTVNLMGLCSLNLLFLIAGRRITFGRAVDRAAVDRAVAGGIFNIFGPRGQGLRARDPIGP